jgi:hypothetical protein
VPGPGTVDYEESRPSRESGCKLEAVLRKTSGIEMGKIPDYNYNSGITVGVCNFSTLFYKEVFNTKQFLKLSFSIMSELCGRIRLKVAEKTVKLVMRQNFRSFYEKEVGIEYE